MDFGFMGDGGIENAPATSRSISAVVRPPCAAKKRSVRGNALEWLVSNFEGGAWLVDVLSVPFERERERERDRDRDRERGRAACAPGGACMLHRNPPLVAHST